MSKKKPEVAVASNEEVKLVTIQTSTNPIEVGTVPIEKLSRRRNNFRKMTKAQKAALKHSIDLSGMQSFIQVVRNGDGTFGIVDGHHRLEELQERGATSVPVIVLPDTVDKDKADMLMLTFNVSAELVDDEFTNLLSEMLNNGTSKEDVAKSAVVSEELLDQLQKTMQDVELPEVAPDDLPVDGLKQGAAKPKKAPKIKLLLIYPLEPNEENEGTQRLAATHMDTIISREARDALAQSGCGLEEIEPMWVDNDLDLIEKLAGESDE